MTTLADVQPAAKAAEDAAMSVAIVLSGLAAISIWLGPETRGRVFKG